MKCTACPRRCGADREKAPGFCGGTATLRAARAALHFWEEPPISGKSGSGAVFLSGCSLRCAFCQNAEISRGNKGKTLTFAQLKEAIDRLIDQGAANINLVNPTHWTDQLCAFFEKYTFPVPVIYNSSGYENVESLKKLDGLIDIYLPDFKYTRPDKAARYSGAADYPEVVLPALREMRRQQPNDIFDGSGMMQKGMIIRHLVLPGNTHSAVEVLDCIRREFPGAYVSLMAQYTPFGDLHDLPELQRRVTRREYEKVVRHAIDIGQNNVFLQDPEAACTDFIPAFDFSGLL
ncbi:MAG: radical SAM protein [Clostridiales bacterium]|nr:radical SAM protein [Clostridiales bacterium]